MNLPSLNADEVADLLEALVLCSESRALGFPELGGLASRALNGQAARVDFALTIIERRQRWLAEAYPFKLSPSALSRTTNVAQSWYASLLMMSPSTIFRALMSQDLLASCSRSFERVAEVTLAAMLGPSASAVRFGWPSECGRPAEFPEAICWLAEKMGLRVGAGYRPPRRKDGGVDIVAWLSFADGRTAFPIMLGQCTIQRDVTTKASDIDLRNWSQWLLTLRDPTTVLLIPFVLSGTSEEWNEVAQRHVIADRIRMCQLLQRSPATPGSISGLTNLVRELLRLAQESISHR